MELNNIINALGWTLINSLWQGLFVLLILAIAMVLINPKFSKIRSIIAFACILFVFAASIRTFSDLYSQQSFSTENINSLLTKESNFALFHEISINANKTANTSISTWDGIINSISSFGSMNINYIVSIWFIGMLFLSVRMLGGYFYMQKMKTQNLLSVSEKWQKKALQISRLLGIDRSVKLFESTIVNFPTVIGYLKPVILMPLGSFSGMPGDQIEMILAHELAHVKRSDYLLNLVQSFLEILYFFNPSVWIISKIIRNEREYACDDLALQLNEDSKVLANALLTLHQNKINKPVVALSAIGSKNSLLGRIKRMVNKNNNHPNYQKKILLSAILIIALFTITSIACSSSMDNSNDQNTLKDPAINLSSESAEVKAFESQEVSPIEEFQSVEDIGEAVQIINLEEGKRKFNFHKDDVHWKGTIENGKLVKLYKDGDRVPENELREHEGFILSTLGEIDDALADIEINMDDLKKDMAQLKDDLKDIKINLDFDELKEIESHFNSDEFKKEMQEVKESLKDIKIDIDFDHIKEIGEHFNSEEFKNEMENMRLELEKIKDLKINFDKESFRESMVELKEGLKDIQINVSDLDIDLTDLKIDLADLKVEMRKLKNFMSDLKKDLVKENIISSIDEDFKLEFSKEKILVDEKVLPANLHKRYLKMYKEHFGKELESSFVIHD